MFFYIERFAITTLSVALLYALHRYLGPFDSGYLILFYFIWLHDVRGK